MLPGPPAGPPHELASVDSVALASEAEVEFKKVLARLADKESALFSNFVRTEEQCKLRGSGSHSLAELQGDCTVGTITSSP